MANRIPVKGIHVMRDGVLVRPPIGKPFNFTPEELDDFARLAPDAIRKPIVEDDGSVVPATKSTRAATGKTSSKGKPATGGESAGADGAATGSETL